MVKVWKETVVIPTYEVGAPEKAPMFLEKRVYQGSSGVVYPYPVIESISDSKTDRPYEALYLENEYIKVMILPELGGRVQMAYDKVKKRHFVYYNHVIKPALVGLAGPWISGGIEFNWPQHHRPSTYMPVDWKLEEHADGSATVWVSEVERMFHQKGMAGFTLRPHCAYLEIHGVLFNPTPVPQTFLWWANPAVAVIGSRKATPRGQALAGHMAGAFASWGITVVSGMAWGIDKAAHEAALGRTGSSIAVLGTGIDVPYPRANTRLYDRMAAKGLLVSEFAPGTPALRENFPVRNRIISGLSLGVVVVEAASRSGTLITSRLALEQGREVYAVPGAALSGQSLGCQELVRQGPSRCSRRKMCWKTLPAHCVTLACRPTI